MKQIFSIIISTIFISFSFSQSKLEIINKIVSEANNNSQLESLAHELMDQIGPRLTGTSQMLQAHDWVIEKYSIGILILKMSNLVNGEHGKEVLVHIDMMSPWVKSLKVNNCHGVLVPRKMVN